MESFELSQEDLNDIASEIVSDRTAFLTSYKEPHFFLNAGQPGAGKTELNNLTRKNLSDDILECNADSLRDYHPDIERIWKNYESSYPELTMPAANYWNQELIKAGIQKRYNIIIETTLGNLNLVSDTLTRIKAAGYTTHLQVLAVPDRWSWLGIHLRYESIKADRGFARRVSAADYADRFKKLRENLPFVLNLAELDSALLYKRRLTTNRNSDTALELVAEGKGKVLTAFYEILDEPMDAAEMPIFLEQVEKVRQYMLDRSARREEIYAFEEDFIKLAR